MMFQPDYSEAALFFRVATIAPAAGDNWVRWRNEARPVDWDRLIMVALAENAITVLNDRLAALPTGPVPSAARERIQHLALVWKLKLSVLEQRLRESVAILSAAGIEVTLLKGAALALTRYPTFADRPMADIDLLVDPARAHDAQALMQRAGWACESPQYAEAAWSDHHHLRPLSDTCGSGLRLELHVAPLADGNPFCFDRQQMREGASRLQIGDAAVLVPEPHVHAVHAAMHFAWAHRFTGGALNTFRDLALLSGSGILSWDHLVATARWTRSETSCYWTLRLARALTQLPVPDATLAELSPALSERMLSVLEHHLAQLVLRSDDACPSVVLRDRLWAMALGIKPPQRVEPSRWETHVGTTTRGPRGSLSRVAGHVIRVPRWSRYVASLLPTVLELPQ